MSETAERHKLHWVPNALTVSRIVLIPVLVWAILKSSGAGQLAPYPDIQMSLIAAFLFIYCIATDFLDGYIARKLSLVSDFGRMLDPIADKLLVAGCLIALCISYYGNAAILIPSLIIIGRDIFVSGIREHAANSNIILSPTKLAKWKTACEMVAILLFIIGLAVSDYQLSNLPESAPLSDMPLRGQMDALMHGSVALLWLAAILSAYTGFHYFRSAMRPR